MQGPSLWALQEEQESVSLCVPSGCKQLTMLGSGKALQFPAAFQIEDHQCKTQVGMRFNYRHLCFFGMQSGRKIAGFTAQPSTLSRLEGGMPKLRPHLLLPTRVLPQLGPHHP